MNFFRGSQYFRDEVKRNNEIQVTTSCHLQLNAPITCSRGQNVAANSELFLFDVIVFAMLPARGIWW